MNILYVSSLCSDKYFNLIFENSTVKPQQQAQKFHSLIKDGLIDLTESMHIISRPPTNPKKEYRKITETKFNGKVTYHHLKIANNIIIRHILLFLNSFLKAIRWNIKYKKKKRIIICDPLNLSISVSTFLASKLFHTKSVAIVTDIPEFMKEYTVKKKSFFNSLFSNCYIGICNFFLQRYDSYIVLTEQMNEIVNPSLKPFIVVEGLVDINMESSPNLLEDKYQEKIIIYAGALYEKYGVKKLIEAFMRLKNENVKLWIYGSGELEEEIKNYEMLDMRIKFYGVVPNNIVVKEQIKATILVNPRPSNEEFTKYSFPSKNMEYMASGTPILTTPLQGMPAEYNDYVYLFEDESVQGITKTLERILEKNKEELHEKGIKAKEFVLEKKNNHIQAKKIMKLIY